MKNKNIISIAKVEDADEIMKFIDNEWKKNHILAINKSFFLYEYENKNQLNFVISKNNNNEINGIQGFLKSSNDKNASVWATIWCASKSNSPPMLGISILSYLREQGYTSVMSNGINEASKEIYKRSFYDAIARDLLSLSVRALSNNCSELFKTLINKISGYKSDLNIIQKIFMLFCNYPKLLKILIKIPLKIKDKII